MALQDRTPIREQEPSVYATTCNHGSTTPESPGNHGWVLIHHQATCAGPRGEPKWGERGKSTVERTSPAAQWRASKCPRIPRAPRNSLGSGLLFAENRNRRRVRAAVCLLTAAIFKVGSPAPCSVGNCAVLKSRGFETLADREGACECFAHASTPAPTSTALTASAAAGARNNSGTLPSGTVVTFTAVVSSGASPVTQFRVRLCDAAVAYCTDIHQLRIAQLQHDGTARHAFASCRAWARAGAPDLSVTLQGSASHTALGRSQPGGDGNDPGRCQKESLENYMELRRG